VSMAAARGQEMVAAVVPDSAGGRRKGWLDQPSPKGRVSRILCCENKRKFEWVAWWAGPNTGKNKKIVFGGWFEWIQRILEFE
jgi:hypothetical protein